MGAVEKSLPLACLFLTSFFLITNMPGRSRSIADDAENDNAYVDACVAYVDACNACNAYADALDAYSRSRKRSASKKCGKKSRSRSRKRSASKKCGKKLRSRSRKRSASKKVRQEIKKPFQEEIRVRIIDLRQKSAESKRRQKESSYGIQKSA